MGAGACNSVNGRPSSLVSGDPSSKKKLLIWSKPIFQPSGRKKTTWLSTLIIELNRSMYKPEVEFGCSNRIHHTLIMRWYSQRLSETILNAKVHVPLIFDLVSLKTYSWDHLQHIKTNTHMNINVLGDNVLLLWYINLLFYSRLLNKSLQLRLTSTVPVVGIELRTFRSNGGHATYALWRFLLL